MIKKPAKELAKKVAAALFILLSAATAQAADKYEFDKDHTHIVFFVNHLGFSYMVGRIKDYDGYFIFDEKDPEKSIVDVTLRSDSVDTDVPALNKELRGEKFFNTHRFPTMHFKSTQTKVTGNNTGTVTGDFTLLGVTKPVMLQVTYNKSGLHPFTGNYVSGFTIEARLRRSDFGMTDFVPEVGDEVIVHIEAEGIDLTRPKENASKGIAK